ncbi:MAG: hypothetical protein EHM70_10645 [Chloroflexota bacterium]|nr:MAG: hypothetical protein EHM70_10645 [Chloroflexota bacterium]
MKKTLYVGLGRYLLPVPGPLWQDQVRKRAASTRQSLGFMTDDHRRVHHFVVRELPRLGKPVPPACISEQLGLPLERIIELLEELEKRMTFLFRNEQGDVAWAYPVTADPTPHQLTFDSGEKIYAA